MADEQMAAGPQVREDTRHDVALGVLVEVDHHVAHEYRVKQTDARQRMIQVDVHELHAHANFRLNDESALLRAYALEAKRAQMGVGNACGTLNGVVPAPGVLQHALADIRRKHFPRAICQRRRECHGDAIGLLAG